MTPLPQSVLTVIVKIPYQNARAILYDFFTNVFFYLQQYTSFLSEEVLYQPEQPVEGRNVKIKIHPRSEYFSVSDVRVTYCCHAPGMLASVALLIGV